METENVFEIESPRVAFVTMGCAKNEVDTQRMQSQLTRCGFAIEQDPEAADAVVVNTCSFIQSATEESLEAIFEVAGMPNVAAGAALIVAGCMPARYGQDLESELSEASAFVPCSKEDDIVQVIAQALGIDQARLERMEAAMLGAVPEGAVAINGSRAVSAYVKISDGCDRFCSYCTIPYIRGRYHSFDYETVRADVADRVSEGVKEIVLIAQDTGRWGQDFEDASSLAWLVGTLADEFADTWFRVMYIQPEGITDELLHTVAEHGNICSYFDPPSACSAEHPEGHASQGFARGVRVAGGAYSPHRPRGNAAHNAYRGLSGKRKKISTSFAISSKRLFRLHRRVRVLARRGTRAYDLPDQVNDDEKAYRAQRLRDLADDVCTPLVAARVGKTMDVLIEGREEDGQLFGRAMCQAPEVDGVTYVDNGEPGDIVRVTITDTLLYEMEGE